MAYTVQAVEVTVFAAASLSDVLQEISARYQKETCDRVVFNFGGSSLLEQQIAQGAPVDVFVSADEAKVDALQKRDLLMPGTRRSFLSNTLVILTRPDYDKPVTNAADLARATRIALAEPNAVPAGIYAREYLQSQGLWPSLAPKVVPCENVRAALAAVESGNADAAIVYKTDAMIARHVKVAVEIPPSEGPKISYALAVIKAASQPVAARRFADFLTSKSARATFKKYGFIIPARTP